MSIKENKGLVSRLLKENRVVPEGVAKIDALMEKYYDPKYVWHIPSGDLDFEQCKKIVREIWAAFPDASYSIDDIVGEGDRVVVRYTMKGTHKGTFRGIAATGKKFTQAGIGIYRTGGGKLLECWMINDSLGLMQQLGAIPSAPTKK